MGILNSAGLLHFNKFLLKRHRFPYPVHLAVIHTLLVPVLLGILYPIFPNLFPSLTVPEKRQAINKRLVLRGLLPIAVLYSALLVLNNCAFLKASVVFLQFIK